MVNHHSTTYADPDLAIPGHNAALVFVLVFVHETRVTGLHCDDCGWYGGSFKPGRWSEKHMAEAWAKHAEYVQAGGVIEHGKAANVDEGICKCVRCSIEWREQRRAGA